jgi:hypothetical protein
MGKILVLIYYLIKAKGHRLKTPKKDKRLVYLSYINSNLSFRRIIYYKKTERI